MRDYAPASKIWAIVKANAYGHGLNSALKGFSGADGLALLDLSQAKTLREMGWSGPTLLLEGVFNQDEYDECLNLKVDLVIHSLNQVVWLENWLSSSPEMIREVAPKRLTFWLKFNSGMNRLGLSSKDYRVAYHRLHSLGFAVNHVTHFANADQLNVRPTVDAQFEKFEGIVRDLPGLRSAANSAATMWHRHTHLDWCRPGIMLYGASPTGRYSDIAKSSLRPAMLLRSEVIGIQEIDVGEAVGYGGRFVANQPKKIAVIACGYADGYPRHAPDGTPVWVANGETIEVGEICGLAGRVSMDMITVDVTNLANVKVGSPVELWGNYVPIDDVAAAADTVGYELMCALAPRVEIKVK